jgi:hypothetical protein
LAQLLLRALRQPTFILAEKEINMGREIRRVPADWEHPKEQKGQYEYGRFVVKEVYKPLYDASFNESAQEWLDELALWVKGEHSDQKDPRYEAEKYPKTIRGYAEFAGDFPRVEYYRPEWTEAECTAYQIYETVSEGTPVSPVFQTEQEIIDWLVEQGHSLNSATQFVTHKWAPSMVMHTQPGGGGTFAVGIDSYDMK